jgi:hypothetical protein
MYPAARRDMRGRRGSLLDPYRPVIDGLVAEGVWNAVVIGRELQARGYAGGVSILRDYLQPKRPLRPGRATVRFETEQGRQLQTDWGEAVELGLTRAARGDVTEVRLVAEAADAGTGAGAEGDAALDGGAHKTGEEQRGLGEGIGPRAAVFRLELAAGEQPPG